MREPTLLAAGNTGAVFHRVPLMPLPERASPTTYRKQKQRRVGCMNMTYDEILEAARHLTTAERARLRSDLTKLDLADRRGSGAAMVEYLRANPLDPEFVDEMERAIEEGCEQVNDRLARRPSHLHRYQRRDPGATSRPGYPLPAGRCGDIHFGHHGR